MLFWTGDVVMIQCGWLWRNCGSLLGWWHHTTTMTTTTAQHSLQESCYKEKTAQSSIELKTPNACWSLPFDESNCTNQHQCMDINCEILYHLKVNPGFVAYEIIWLNCVGYFGCAISCACCPAAVGLTWSAINVFMHNGFHAPSGGSTLGSSGSKSKFLQLNEPH